VKLDEPSEETAVLILRGLKSKYEEAHHVMVRDDAIQAAAVLSSRYISGRQLPDKAVDLLDTSAARVKVLLTAKPDVIEDKERTIQALEREKRALERDQLHKIDIDEERYKETNDALEKFNAEVVELKERWLKEQELANKVIDIRSSLYELKSREGAEAEKENELITQMEEAAKQLEALQGDSPGMKLKISSSWKRI